MDEKLNPKDKVLLMRDEGEGNKLKVVKGIDKKGKIDAIDPLKAKQTDFIKIDRHADPLENFFKNFFNQAKNPSHTGFYAVTVDMLDKVLSLSDKELEKFRIDPREYLNKEQEQSTKETKQESTKEQVPEEKKEKMETTTEQKTEFKQFDTNRIPKSEYQKYGIKPENLEGELKAMSYGYKSPHLVDINPNIEGVDYPMKARLSLEEQPDGSLKFIPHPQQQQVDLDKPFQGIMLPNDVKENLLATGNAGRIVELEPKPGEKVPSLVSIDKLTNRLEAVPLDKLTVSQNLKGAELTPEQQQAIKEGKKVLVEGMTSKNTIGTDNPRKFDAHVQFNAAKGGYDFSYEGLDRNKYSQNSRQEQGQNQEQNQVRIPKKLLGVDLDEKQQNSLRENKAVYVQGMLKDGKGEPFNAYVKVNNEKGKLDFFKWNPDKAKKQGADVKVAEGNKTQVAVNSQGKTNEATKHSKEPLKQGQQNPTEKQDKEQKQQQGVKKPVKKSTGHKM
jgi:primosomal replication protein N